MSLAPAVTIRVKASRELLDRIDVIARRHEVLPGDFIEYAIEKEVRRQEISRLREDIAMEEIQQNILRDGQSFDIQLEDDSTQMESCSLCLSWGPSLESQVEGPFLCETCLDLAKGADFRPLETDI